MAYVGSGDQNLDSLVCEARALSAVPSPQPVVELCGGFDKSVSKERKVRGSPGLPPAPPLMSQQRLTPVLDPLVPTSQALGFQMSPNLH